MKTSKLFTIDTDLAERLKNTNASAIVNALLKEYFELRSGKNTLKDEKKAVFDAISKKKRYFREKLRLLIRGIHLVWTILRKYGLRRGRKVLREVPYLLTLPEEELKLMQKDLKKLLNSTENTEKC